MTDHSTPDPTNAKAEPVVVGADDIHWFEEAFRAWECNDMAGVLDGLTSAVNYFVPSPAAPVAAVPGWMPTCAKAPGHLIERLRHHATDKQNSAFARSTMAEVLSYLVVAPEVKP
jgi:hypothetical protein